MICFTAGQLNRLNYYTPLLLICQEKVSSKVGLSLFLARHKDGPIGEGYNEAK
jgi:hypothetical protein